MQVSLTLHTHAHAHTHTHTDCTQYILITFALISTPQYYTNKRSSHEVKHTKTKPRLSPAVKRDEGKRSVISLLITLLQV